MLLPFGSRLSYAMHCYSLFSPPTRTRQNSVYRVGGVNKLLRDEFDDGGVLCVVQEESKPSPLTLLAQTCNSIGRDSTSTSAAAAKSKSAGDDAKSTSCSRPHDTPSDAERLSTPQTGTDIKDAGTKLTSSPVDVVATPRPSTTTAATARALSAELGRRRARSPSPVKASPSPPSSPSRRRGVEDKSTGEYRLASSVHGVSDPDGLYAMQYLAAVAALQRQSAAVDAGLFPYLAAQRLPVHPLASASDRPSHCAAGGPLSPLAGRPKPGSCSDPCCSRCLQLNAVAAAVATSSRGTGCVGVGCSQCGSHPQPSTSSSSSTVLPSGGHGAFAAALSALCRLPAPGPPGSDSSVGSASSTSSLPPVHTCNWLHPGGAYCGRRFSTVDDLMQHLHSHCGTTADPPTATFAPDLHPIATGSLFAPLAVLYGASSTYPPLDFMPPALPPPAAQVQLPSTTVSPSSLLRQHHHHSLAVAAAAAATRYHPYRVPPTLLPPSAASTAYPSSLAAYYGALCGVAPGSNGTVPAVRL